MTFPLKRYELKYLWAFTAPAVAFIALFWGGVHSFALLIQAFTLIPILDELLPERRANFSKEEEKSVSDNRFFDVLLYLMVPAHWALLGLFLYRVSSPDILLYEKIGMTMSFGILTGLGINIAHELGHRKGVWNQLAARLLLTHTFYTHFVIEHNRWHHRFVSTPLDPASSRLNEPLYTFWFRSVFGTWRKAWTLVSEDLKKEGKSFWSFSNGVLWWQVLTVVYLAVVFGFFGWQSLLWTIGAGIVGILLLETVNYIEHYGLARREVRPGIYEAVQPYHSWNSDHPVGRVMLFELTRHSDHHYRASRKYQILRRLEPTPQLPTGYPGCLLLALVPPLWFRVMNPRVRGFQQELAAAVPAPKEEALAA